MAKKLEGFSKVAVVNKGCCNYHFAIYDDGNDYKAGDTVVFSGNTPPSKITDIIDVEKSKSEFTNNIIAEVIGKVDTSAYEKRIALREEKCVLKKELEARKKELQKMFEDEYYANMDETYAELLKKHNSITV